MRTSSVPQLRLPVLNRMLDQLRGTFALISTSLNEAEQQCRRHGTVVTSVERYGMIFNPSRPSKSADQARSTGV
ncbi:hypothetical protein LOC67_07765 [Stieleria sp. JC731]|uniref:hypothetical protein n=1 Tax=Pirellulaceae TaxID=2691357 RepID=UPI001E2CF7D3|nr:hypothetical protein [Stieleria sp. JC731]MCC9600454.1 hypothetical protein [Stieleria sp. JC731]